MEERLTCFLSEAGRGQAALFVAACVERGSGVFFLAVGSDDARRADVDLYLEFLDDLWRGPDLSPADCEERRDRLAAFAELEGDEEPPGILAFAYDAVAAMYYAYSYLASGEAEDVTSCSNHMLNSAGFIDDAGGAVKIHYQNEISAQVTSLEALSGEAPPADPSSWRSRAQADGRARVEALRKVFA